MKLGPKQLTLGSLMIGIAIFAVVFVYPGFFVGAVVVIFLPLIPALPVIFLYGLAAAVRFVILSYRRDGISGVAVPHAPDPIAGQEP